MHGCGWDASGAATRHGAMLWLCVMSLVWAGHVVGLVGVQSFRINRGVTGMSGCGARVSAVYSVT